MWREHMYSWHDSNGLLCQPHTHRFIIQYVSLNLSTPAHITDTVLQVTNAVSLVCVWKFFPGDSNSASINGNERHLLRNSSPKMAAHLPHQMWKQETESEPRSHYHLNLVNSRMKQPLLNQQVGLQLEALNCKM